MRAGLAAAGLELVLKLFSASEGYGFELQPTGARESCKRTPHLSRKCLQALPGSAFQL